MISENYIWLMMICLAIHYIADFVCQSSTIATGKATSIELLSEHIYVSWIVWVLFWPIFWIFNVDYDTYLIFLLVNILFHFITDYFTSKVTHYHNSRGETKMFWNTIGFDQLCHIIVITYTLRYLV